MGKSGYDKLLIKKNVCRLGSFKLIQFIFGWTTSVKKQISAGSVRCEIVLSWICLPEGCLRYKNPRELS